MFSEETVPTSRVLDRFLFSNYLNDIQLFNSFCTNGIFHKV